MQLQAAREVEQFASLQAVLHAYLLAPDELPARARLSAVHARAAESPLQAGRPGGAPDAQRGSQALDILLGAGEVVAAALVAPLRLLQYARQLSAARQEPVSP